MKRKTLAAVLIYLFAFGQLFAQDAAISDNRSLVEKFQKHEHFDNFSQVLEKFSTISLPVSSDSPHFIKAPEGIKGKFKIDAKYVGLLVGNSVYCFLYIYGMDGNYSDHDLIFDYEEYYELYDEATVLDFNLSKDLNLYIMCDGYYCEGYPHTLKIIDGKFVKQ